MCMRVVKSFCVRQSVMLIIFKWHQFDPYNPFCGWIPCRLQYNTEHIQHNCSFFHSHSHTSLSFSAVCKWERLNGVCMHEIIMCSLSLFLPSCFFPFGLCLCLYECEIFKTYGLECLHCLHIFYFPSHSISITVLSHTLYTTNQIDISPSIKECGKKKEHIESIIIQLKKLIPLSLFGGYNKWSVDKGSCAIISRGYNTFVR